MVPENVFTSYYDGDLFQCVALRCPFLFTVCCSFLTASLSFVLVVIFLAVKHSPTARRLYMRYILQIHVSTSAFALHCSALLCADRTRRIHTEFDRKFA